MSMLGAVCDWYQGQTSPFTYCGLIMTYGNISISGSTLVQVMACCLVAPSHYLNQCWLAINDILCYSFHGCVYLITQDINPQVFEIYPFDIIAISLRGQWVNPLTVENWEKNAGMLLCVWDMYKWIYCWCNCYLIDNLLLQSDYKLLGNQMAMSTDLS